MKEIQKAFVKDNLTNIEMVSYKVKGDSRWLAGMAIVTISTSVIFDQNLNVVMNPVMVSATNSINVDVKRMMQSNQQVHDIHDNKPKLKLEK